MTMLPMSRRRVLFIGAAFAGAALLSDVAQIGKTRRWRGTALGADSEIVLVNAPEDVAETAFQAVETEIARLENIFSLYREDSALSRLNRNGRLNAPPAELLTVLAAARTAHRLTGGLFDPTVQPLFVLYAEKGAAPPPRALSAALSCVGFDAVQFDERAITFGRPGMALTLNGIAQGYITDCVADLLRGYGFADMLVDIGEIRALGERAEGGGWRIGIATAPGSEDIAQTITVTDKAVATSMPRGTLIDAAGLVGHILHPRHGATPGIHARVTVVAPTAIMADAFSTAAVLMETDALRSLANENFDFYI